eukprot:TRINITY_DN26428_c1_g3_i2.p1 TRINITY_DN26428_c1_g3~~TRINITY_DN26428_c1_g3_i2.p1  ORF type:complete len:763 (+),score=128.11 TRINITY_DN26428_c1_g3_i2:222-2510(+)
MEILQMAGKPEEALEGLDAAALLAAVSAAPAISTGSASASAPVGLANLRMEAGARSASSRSTGAVPGRFRQSRNSTSSQESLVPKAGGAKGRADLSPLLRAADPPQSNILDLPKTEVSRSQTPALDEIMRMHEEFNGAGARDAGDAESSKNGFALNGRTPSADDLIMDDATAASIMQTDPTVVGKSEGLNGLVRSSRSSRTSRSKRAAKPVKRQETETLFAQYPDAPAASSKAWAQYPDAPAASSKAWASELRLLQQRFAADMEKLIEKHCGEVATKDHESFQDGALHASTHKAASFLAWEFGLDGAAGDSGAGALAYQGEDVRTTVRPVAPKRLSLNEQVGMEVAESQRKSLAKVRAPQNRLYQFVYGLPFTIFSSLIIFINSIFIGLKVQAELNHLTVPNEHIHAWELGSICFTAWFTLELFLRMAVGLKFFVFGKEWFWNYFDFSIVALSIADLVLQLNISALRAFRLIRIVRIVRMNSISFIRNIKSMFLSLGNTWSSFAPALVIVYVVIYIFGVGFMSGVADHLKAFPLDPNRKDLLESFGTLWKTVLTLLGCVSGGADWLDVFNLVATTGFIFEIGFVTFICFVLFVVMNVLTGIFVQCALSASALSRDIAIEETMSQTKTMRNEIVKLLNECDESEGPETRSDGGATWENLIYRLKDERVRNYFTTLDLDVGSVKKVFEVIRDEHPEKQPNLQELISHCLEMRGSAKAVDIHMLSRDLSIMQYNIEKKVGKLDKSFSNFFSRSHRYTDQASKSMR